jgi:hypothetical protein
VVVPKFAYVISIVLCLLSYVNCKYMVGANITFQPPEFLTTNPFERTCFLMPHEETRDKPFQDTNNPKTRFLP